MTQPTRCESSACFTVDTVGGSVHIRGGVGSPWLGVAVDTVEAFTTFRDAIKAGDYDHIGQEQT
ncbi:hypothetical protein [Catelliglobosispora koreensis]|uniref:hypothetical protein n=1 Tax=Catelliglobosispora koreensis TaxID=129052 RepID=UPI0003656DBC|nr:hypothetical protein [Catelliglobosispora koreensis]